MMGLRLMKSLLATMIAATILANGSWAGPEAVQNMQQPQAGVHAEFSFGGERNREFMLDGKPFQIRSGEMHPQRIPRQHWRHRIRAAKAMGLNTIAFYVFWNGLEREDGSFDLTGMRDIAAFIDLCAEEGMWALFRPGPYVCGEWDLGGLPARLLAERGAKLRTVRNPAFMAAQKAYLEKMAEIAIPRLCKNGGPILMIQLENEYGSYRVPHAGRDYIEWLKAFWEGKGAGPFYVSEGATPRHLRHAVPGVALGLDPMESEETLRCAQAISPDAPVFSSETYPGWLRHWGEGNWAPETGVLNSVRWYMEQGHSFNLFVLHGGTSFGLAAGANCPATLNNDGIEPDVTSYDYGSPVGEHGNLTPLYFACRDVIAAALPHGAQLPEPPATPESMEIPPFIPGKVAGIGDLASPALPAEAKGPTLPTFEEMGQNQGLALYQAKLPAGPAVFLNLPVHDIAQVFVDGRYIGTVDRTKTQPGLMVPARGGEAELLVVVDTFGHINFSAAMETDNKGIIGEATLGTLPLREWAIWRLPLQQQPAACTAGGRPDVPMGGLFEAKVALGKAADTFLDMGQWTKGYVWVNGHLLGRYWNLGPQQRLYCPAEWLHAGANSVVVLDLFRDKPAPIAGKTERNTEILRETRNANNAWD